MLCWPAACTIQLPAHCLLVAYQKLKLTIALLQKKFFKFLKVLALCTSHVLASRRSISKIKYANNLVLKANEKETLQDMLDRLVVTGRKME